MKTFEFIILFFSFAFTLALTHLLFAATRMIRYRRKLTFSWLHALWMANALMLLFANWISLFDFRDVNSMRLSTILILFIFVITLYFSCALVAPDFEEGESYDMRAFHQRESRTYIGALAALLVMSFVANIDATEAGIGVWGSENQIVALMIPMTILPIAFRNNAIVQWACPLLLLGLTMAFLVIFYPTLT